VQTIENVHYNSSPSGIIWQTRAQLLEQLVNISGDQEAKGLIAALAFGNRTLLRDTPLETAFQRTGLAHFLSVSGTHLGILGVLLLFILRKSKLSRVWVSLITLAVCLGYVFFTGFAPGSIRACSMLALALFAYLLKRRVCVLNSLALVGLTLLIIDPLLAVSLGFLFSFCSVAGIVLFSRYAQQWLVCLIPRGFLSKRNRAYAGRLAMSLVACAITLPLSTEAFGIVSTIAPFANFLIGPLICALLGFGLLSALLLLFNQYTGSLLLQFCLLAAEIVVKLVKTFASLRFASIPTKGLDTIALLVFIALMACVWLWWPRPTPKRARIAGVLALCLVLIVAIAPHLPFRQSPRTASTKEVVVLDVGQGDALLIRDGDMNALIDTGPSEKRLREQLLEQNVRHIDLLFLTHDHADHARGARALDASYRIERIVVSEGAQSSPVFQNIAQQIHAPLEGALCGEVYRLNALEIRIIAPANAVNDPSANPSCLITLIVDTTPDDEDLVSDDILLTSGDAEADDINKALDNPATKPALTINGKDSTIDILKVPHHGSKKSVDERLLTRLKAHLAVISVGAGNQYGHPRPEPLSLLEKYLKTIYRTDLHGAVLIPL